MQIPTEAHKAVVRGEIDSICADGEAGYQELLDTIAGSWLSTLVMWALNNGYGEDELKDEISKQFNEFLNDCGMLLAIARQETNRIVVHATRKNHKDN
jgi:hypothetical protein